MIFDSWPGFQRLGRRNNEADRKPVIHPYDKLPVARTGGCWWKRGVMFNSLWPESCRKIYSKQRYAIMLARQTNHRNASKYCWKQRMAKLAYASWIETYESLRRVQHTRIKFMIFYPVPAWVFSPSRQKGLFSFGPVGLGWFQFYLLALSGIL